MERNLTENEVVLLQLTRANLLLERVAAEVDVGKQAVLIARLLNLLGVIVDGGHDGYNQHLARAEPEGPFACKVLREDTNHTLETTQDSTVNHDRSGITHGQVLLNTGTVGGRLILGLDVSKLESLRQVEIQLDRAALVVSSQGVVYSDVNLRAVESTIARILLPFGANSLRERVKGILELGFGHIPHGNVANILLWSRRQL